MQLRDVFISYAHTSIRHKAWVKRLADAIRTHSITVVLDQDDLRLGQLIERFQRDGIASARRVVVICSDAYVDKCDVDPDSGAGQEKALMKLELMNNGDSTKFIPLFRDNVSKKLPSCLLGRLWIDGNSPKRLSEVVATLVQEVQREPVQSRY